MLVYPQLIPSSIRVQVWLMQQTMCMCCSILQEPSEWSVVQLWRPSCLQASSRCCCQQVGVFVVLPETSCSDTVHRAITAVGLVSLQCVIQQQTIWCSCPQSVWYCLFFLSTNCKMRHNFKFDKMDVVKSWFFEHVFWIFCTVKFMSRQQLLLFEVILFLY